MQRMEGEGKEDVLKDGEGRGEESGMCQRCEEERKRCQKRKGRKEEGGM